MMVNERDGKKWACLQPFKALLADSKEEEMLESGLLLMEWKEEDLELGEDEVEEEDDL